MLSSVVPVFAHAHWQWEWAGFREALLLEHSVDGAGVLTQRDLSQQRWQHMHQEKGINHSSDKSPGVLKEVCYLLVKGYVKSVLSLVRSGQSHDLCSASSTAQVQLLLFPPALGSTRLALVLGL